MIPVRARVDSPITTTGIRPPMHPDHPMAQAGVRCPACDGPLTDRPITFVIVGIDPEQRAQSKQYAACGAVVVHADCAGLRDEDDKEDPS